MLPNWSIASTGIFLTFLQRKAKTAVKVLRNGGFRKFLQICWIKLRQPLIKWREEWEWIQIDGCDYLMVSNVNGFTMLVSRTDEGIGRELAFYRVHEPTVTKLLPGFVQQGDTVLDIGANIGYYTLLLSQLVGANGVVVAIEPHPENFHLLELNLRLNRVTNVKVIPVAVSDEVGTAEMFVAEGSNWHSLHPTERTGQKTILVPTVIIDTIVHQLERSIDLIRMDIEGWEIKALQSAEGTLRRDRPTLVIEFHPFYLQEGEIQKLLVWLQSFGYERGFVVLRADDFPWVKRPRRVWERTISALIKDEELMNSKECFTLLLERPRV